MSEKNEIILRETAAIVDSVTLMKTPVKDLDDGQAVTAWAVLDVMEKEILGARKKEFRAHLMDVAAKKGSINSNGSFKYALPNSSATITKQRNRGKITIDKEKALETLSEEALNVCCKYTLELTPQQFAQIKNNVSMSCLDGVSFRVDGEALEGAFKLGLITEGQLDEISTEGDPSYVFKMKKPAEVLALLERSKGDGKGNGKTKK
jgi:hypothetical protein